MQFAQQRHSAAAKGREIDSSWADGQTVRFGRKDEREVAVFAGLFRYSGFGLGHYYSTAHQIEWLYKTDAKARAASEGVAFVYWDSECGDAPVVEMAATTEPAMSWHPQELGTKNGNPAVVWWRHGVAAKGEPSRVTEVREYATEGEALQAVLEGARRSGRAMAADEQPTMPWVGIEQRLPPEQKNIVVMLDSGVPLLGRNIDGRFCQYDSINDRMVEWMEGESSGFHGIVRWCEVVDEGGAEKSAARSLSSVPASHEVRELSAECDESPSP